MRAPLHQGRNCVERLLPPWFQSALCRTALVHGPIRDATTLARRGLRVKRAGKINQARRVDGIFLSDFERGEIGPEVPARLPDGAGGVGFKAPREFVSRRRVPALDQGQEPANCAV
jgi:hypothetical protein